MHYSPDPTRYDTMRYRKAGHSGLSLPEISLGLWHNFGANSDPGTIRSMCCRAFDLGVTHFDLANNYGPPPGSAEESFGKLLRTEFQSLRDELIVSSKAGYGMWPGPYGDGGSRKYLISSLDQTLQRLGIDYVDVFYSHRFDPDTPLEETMGALDSIVRQGKALYVGISNYSTTQTVEAAAILKSLGTPCVLHQPRYSMFDRWIEDEGLLDTLHSNGIGMIAFSPLAQGMLTDRYLNGIPDDSRAALAQFLKPGEVSGQRLDQIVSLNAVAEARGQTLAQMALSWVLRDPRVTSTIIGASRVSQIEDCIQASGRSNFSEEELSQIDSICAAA